jgi:hypothetical protein
MSAPRQDHFVLCRPEDPPFIKEAEVLWNPFDDIEPRTTRAERLAAAEQWGFLMTVVMDRVQTGVALALMTCHKQWKCTDAVDIWAES